MGSRVTEEDIRRVYRETIDPLYGYVSRRCEGNRALAEDIVSDTWLRAVRTWTSNGIPERPLAWLSTVAGRLLVDHHRTASAHTHRSDMTDGLIAPDEVERVERDERRSLMERAMSQLPLLQSRLLEAFHYDRQPVAEIAGSLGLSERSVEGRLRRARLKLRTIIEADPRTKEIKP